MQYDSRSNNDYALNVHEYSTNYNNINFFC